jgi:hypothetical protein
LLDVIRVFKPNSASGARLSSSAEGVDLAPICIQNSTLLHRLHLGSIGAVMSSSIFALCTSCDLDWLVLGLLIIILLAVWFSLIQKKSSEPQGFMIVNNQWWLSSPQKKRQVRLYDDIVVWPWVVILPLQDINTKRKTHLVIAVDAVSEKDWRHLRGWLKMALPHAG